MLPPAPQERPIESHFKDGEKHNSTESSVGDTRKAAGQTHVFKREEHMTPQKKVSVTELATEAVNMDKSGSQLMENNTVLQRKEKNGDKQDVTEKKSGRKPKKNTRGMKVLKKKDKDKDKLAEQKVDFPEPLVKAHQAVYAFLNPNINKYDVVLGLLEQVTQTQTSVQPMVAFMALRYEETIQVLEEMADEGEKVYKEYGEHLAWPSRMKNLSSSPPLKSGSTNIEPPPDLLQQLLQYTTQRMWNVSQTVGGLGDSALEEAVEYFASVSELLQEKLKVKRAVETRLMQLLSRIEMASLRKPGPEDSALFSEDSGIGAENESLAGSEKRHRRESCESTGTNRTTPISHMGYTSMNIRQGVSRQKLACQISPSVSLTSLNSLGSACTIMANEQRDSLLGSVSFDDGEEDDEDEDKMDENNGNENVGFRSNSSPVNREQQQQPRRLPPKRIENPENVEMTLKMKKAISGRIQFVPSPTSSAKTKIVGSPKTSRRQWTDGVEQSPKRPQTAAPVQKAVVKTTTAAKERRSRSAESLRSKGEDPTLLELERTQKNLNQRLQRMSKSKTIGNMRTAPSKQNQGTSPAHSPAANHTRPSLEKNSNPHPLKDKAGLIRRINKKQEVSSDVEEDNRQKDQKTAKGPIKATPPPSPPLSPKPSSGLCRGRNSVKKLIDTFSQGIEELEDPKVLGPLKGVRKCGVPVLPGLGNVEAVLSAGITSCRPECTSYEKTDYLDLDSLPPPPLEVLMDNSFESAQSLPDDGATKVSKSPVVKRAAVSQRLRASFQSVPVLPSKGGLPQGSKVISPARVDQQVTSAQSKVSQPDVQAETDPQKEKSSTLSRQARNIIHLRHASDSQSEKLSTSYVTANPPASKEKSTELQGDGNLSVPGSYTTVSTVPPSSVASSIPPATPPMSKGRMLPSAPSTPSSLHRRLPSPHNFKRQPTPPSSDSPPVTRELPTTPAVQRRLPSPPVTKQNILNSNPPSSYPFKAPSPPASPKVQRWSREKSKEDSSSSRLISNARSVFCPASPSLFEAQPCPVPRPPQAWTSTGVTFLSGPWGSRGRFPVSFQGPRPFIRRSHSDRRPSLTLPPRSPGISVAETCGSEPALCTRGLDDEPTREDEIWGSQSDLRATPRSASHPDLCVVGQSLHRE
ncbi:hypothetical protein PAMA_004433 [Pampus argenteus]